MKKALSNDDVPSQNDARVPWLVESEAKIAAKAPAALRTLKELNAMDLAEMLGLDIHTEVAI